MRPTGDIQSAINAAGGQLPKNLPSPPSYKKVNPAEPPVLIFVVHSDALPIEAVDDAAENILVQNISQISGVAQVNVLGQQKPAVRIQIDPGEDRRHGPQPRGSPRGDRERHHR
jgi:HAE1 family hydrophobic/amphiphilic exporter-1